MCLQPNLSGKLRVDILKRLADMETAGGRAAMIFQMVEKLDESTNIADKSENSMSKDTKKTK